MSEEPGTEPFCRVYEHSIRVAVPAFLFTVGMAVADTLPQLEGRQPPQSVEELWANYDPDAEPLEVEVIREFEEEGITIRMLTYTIGSFRGKKSRMVGYYGFPTGTKAKLPALIQMHGGGQRAEVHSIRYAAQNGYACLALNWGGRTLERAREGDPGTDWGAVDATQTGHNSHYGSLIPDDRTVDTVESPRNSNWFLIVMAARRGVSFLQKQAEVDPDRIGAFGHSMGGKLTVMLAGSDERIVAAAPSCGGGGSAPGDIRARANAGVRPRKSALWHRTIDDPPYLERITAPILYMGPQNDFNGILDNVYANWERLESKVVNYTVNPHMNHRATPEHVFPGMLFFEAHLKGAFDFPVTPELRVTLEEKDGIPRASLVPDQPGRVTEVEIYYSVDSHILTRFWRTAIAEREGNSWSARLPVFSTGQPLFVMANVYYRLDHKVVGYRWMKKPPGTFGVSSGMRSFTPEQLASSGVKGNGKQNPMIEEEFSDYQDWYRLDWKNPHWWSVWTRKVKDPGFAAPAGAKLLLDVKVEDDTTLFFVVKDNSWGAFPGIRRQGEFYARVDLKGSPAWQTLGVTPGDFKLLEGRQNYALQSWKHVTELGLRGRVVLPGEGRRIELPEGSEVGWRSPRFFRNLRWEVP
ncbi:MAG: acetylxylan esterase [Roseibacillus sp.]